MNKSEFESKLIDDLKSGNVPFTQEKADWVLSLWCSWVRFEELLENAGLDYLPDPDCVTELCENWMVGAMEESDRLGGVEPPRSEEKCREDAKGLLAYQPHGRHSLSEEDWEHLVRGGTLCFGGGVEIALQDIGYMRMQKLLAQAQLDEKTRLGEERKVR